MTSGLAIPAPEHTRPCDLVISTGEERMLRTCKTYSSVHHLHVQKEPAERLTPSTPLHSLIPGFAQVPAWLVSKTLPTALLCRWLHPVLVVAVPSPQHLDLTEMQVRYWAKNSPKQSVPICCCSSHLNLFHREIERVMSQVLAISPSPP